MKESKLEKNTVLITFLFIPVALMLAFVVYPALEMVRYSLTNWDGASRSYDYIGIRNYVKVLFGSKEVWQSFKNNMIYLIVSFAFIPVEILFAVFLNNKRKAQTYSNPYISCPISLTVSPFLMCFPTFTAPRTAG